MTLLIHFIHENAGILLNIAIYCHKIGAPHFWLNHVKPILDIKTHHGVTTERNH